MACCLACFVIQGEIHFVILLKPWQIAAYCCFCWWARVSEHFFNKCICVHHAASCVLWLTSPAYVLYSTGGVLLYMQMIVNVCRRFAVSFPEHLQGGCPCSYYWACALCVASGFGLASIEHFCTQATFLWHCWNSRTLYRCGRSYMSRQRHQHLSVWIVHLSGHLYGRWTPLSWS